MVRAGESLMKLVSDLKQYLILNDFPSVNEAISQNSNMFKEMQVYLVHFDSVFPGIFWYEVVIFLFEPTPIDLITSTRYQVLTHLTRSFRESVKNPRFKTWC